jgi:hypothetical protein
MSSPSIVCSTCGTVWDCPGTGSTASGIEKWWVGEGSEVLQSWRPLVEVLKVESSLALKMYPSEGLETPRRGTQGFLTWAFRPWCTSWWRHGSRCRRGIPLLSPRKPCRRTRTTRLRRSWRRISRLRATCRPRITTSCWWRFHGLDSPLPQDWLVVGGVCSRPGSDGTWVLCRTSAIAPKKIFCRDDD